MIYSPKAKRIIQTAILATSLAKPIPWLAFRQFSNLFDENHRAKNQRMAFSCKLLAVHFLFHIEDIIQYFGNDLWHEFWDRDWENHDTSFFWRRTPTSRNHYSKHFELLENIFSSHLHPPFTQGPLCGGVSRFQIVIATFSHHHVFFSTTMIIQTRSARYACCRQQIPCHCLYVFCSQTTND